MASCEDDFTLLDEPSQNHHHHHHSHHFTPRFAPKPLPPVHSVHKAAAAAAAAVEDGDGYSDTGFCSQGNPKLPPSFHDGIAGVNPFADQFGAGEEEEEHDCDRDHDHDRKSRARRKDRDELSDGGTPFSYKKSKPGTSGGGGGGGSGDYRKDREEWSDSAIGCLLDAYTEKYVQLNKGNLRGRDWEEVAAIVSDRCDKQRSCKSVEQCKNKVDNLKKRYKAERHRLSSGSLGASHWPWFKKMEQVVGCSNSAKGVSDEDRSVGGSGGIARQTKRYTVVTPTPVGVPNNLKMKSSSPRWRRVVFKISGTSLAGNGPQHIDPKVTTLIAREVAHATRIGVEVAIVVGGRNFFCGNSWVAATGLDRAAAYQIGMMATVMNSILLQSSIENQGVQTRVQTAISMQEVAEPYIRRRAIRHLEKGRVVIFGAGTGNHLLTTDTAAALRASEINADVVLKGTNVDSIYGCHSRNNNAGGFEHISFREYASRGLPGMDMTAMTLCEENCIPVVVFNLLEPGNISRALCGEQVGTYIDQSGRIG